MNDNQYARDKHGNILRDSYGRPVPRRESRTRQMRQRQQPQQARPEQPAQQPTQQPETPEQRRLRLAKQARAEWEARHNVTPPPPPRTQSPFGMRTQGPQYGQQSGQAQGLQYGQGSGQTQGPQNAQSQGLQYGQQSAQQPRLQPQPVQSPQPQLQPQQQPRRRRQKKPLTAGGCMKRAVQALVLVLVLCIAGLAWADTKLTRIDALSAHSVGSTAGTNWLLVGSDSRQGLTEDDVQRLGTGGDIGVGRTDTIMVLHLPLVGEPTLLSIPRDSYVNIAGVGMDKINAAFAIGGPQLLVSTVEESTGLHIDHYAEIGFGGFAGMVDAVGGVELCPSEPIDDPLANLNVQAGCQKMDGAQALGYVRTRATAMGDLDRVARQREFFAALVGKVTSPSVLLNPFRSLRLVSNAAGSFTVNKGDHVWSLLRAAIAAGGGLKMETVPVGGFMDTEVGNVVLWEEPAAQELFKQLS